MLEGKEVVEALLAEGLCLTCISDFLELLVPKQVPAFNPLFCSVLAINKFWNDFLILGAKFFVIKTSLLFLIFNNMNNVFIILLAMRGFLHGSTTNFLQNRHFSFSPYYWQVLKE